jgi:hypothetical protein
MRRMFTIVLTVCFGFFLAIVGVAQQTNQPQQAGAAPAPAPSSGTSGPPASATAPVGQASTGTPAPPPSAPAQRSAAELEKLVMPIALHPDPLVAIVLPASVYPLEVVQAARFVKDTNNIPKVDQQSWDENVKAVARFPDLIAKMDADLGWTTELGKGFLDQPKELMDTIQSLRAKAKQAGTLQSSSQQVVSVTNEVVTVTNVTDVAPQVVTVTNTVVQIQPSNPEVIYVPSYPSTVYYPPPSYVYDPYAPLVTFGVGMAMGAVIANNCDWHGGGVYVGRHGVAAWGGGYGDVDVDVDKNVNVNRTDNVNRNVNRTENANRSTTQSGNRTANTGGTQQKWQPDPNRVQNSGASASAQTRESRGWGSSSQSPQQVASGANRPAQTSAGSAANRPAQPPSATRALGRRKRLRPVAVLIGLHKRRRPAAALARHKRRSLDPDHRRVAIGPALLHRPRGLQLHQPRPNPPAGPVPAVGLRPRSAV